MQSQTSKRILPTVQSAVEFEELVLAKQPCVLRVPLGDRELSDLRDASMVACAARTPSTC